MRTCRRTDMARAGGSNPALRPRESPGPCDAYEPALSAHFVPGRTKLHCAIGHEVLYDGSTGLGFVLQGDPDQPGRSSRIEPGTPLHMCSSFVRKAAIVIFRPAETFS